MKSFRSILFWMHLACGVAAGVVILIMCVTGVALTYEKQMLEWADRNAWTAPSQAGARPLPPETLLAKVIEAQSGAAPTGITLRADASAPATVTLDGNKTLLVDPYTGAIIGDPPGAMRSFFRTMTTWHRYLALEGTSRATGKAITGAANFIFLFIVLSGMYLWLPRVWKWIQFKNVLWFRGGLASEGPRLQLAQRHRDLVGRPAGDRGPRRDADLVSVGQQSRLPPGGRDAAGASRCAAGRGAAGERREPATYVTDGLDASWSTAQQQMPAWRTMTTRLATSAKAPIVLTVDEGYGGQPQKRTTLTVDRATATVAKAEVFERSERRTAAPFVAAVRAHRRDLWPDGSDHCRSRFRWRCGARLHGHRARAAAVRLVVSAAPRRRSLGYSKSSLVGSRFRLLKSASEGFLRHGRSCCIRRSCPVRFVGRLCPGSTFRSRAGWKRRRRRWRHHRCQTQLKRR